MVMVSKRLSCALQPSLAPRERGDMTTREESITDLLMGAAHADGHLDGREMQRVRELLRVATNTAVLDAGLKARMRAFKPGALEIGAVVGQLGLTSAEEKRQLLELIAAVHEADDTWDFSEDEYLRAVARAMDVPASAYADLTMEDLHIEVIGASLLPPPLPKP